MVSFMDDGSIQDAYKAEADRLRAELDAARQQVAERDRTIRALRNQLKCVDDQMATWCSSEYADHPLRIATLALLAAPAPAPDDETRRLREALENPPYDDYYDALREGCDHEAAWGCFKEAYAEHARAALAPAPDAKGEGEGDNGT